MYQDGGALAMKMKINVEFTDIKGNEVVRSVAIDADVPDFDEFTGPEQFREVFDKYEKAVLKARNKAAEIATEEYLAELSKKKRPMK